MRLWQGVALTISAVTLIVALWLIHEVSAQQNVQGGVIAAAQPAPGFQPPMPSGPFGLPGQPPGMPPVPGGPVPPFAPPPNIAIAANPDFVYLVWGNMLLQFDAKTLKLIRRVPLKGEFPREQPEKLAQPEKSKGEKERPKEERTKKDQPREEQPKTEK